MTRALTTLAAVLALAVSAAPASAGSSKKPPPRTGAVVVLIGANDYGLVAKSPPRRTTGIVTDNKDPDKLGKVNAMFFPWDMASKAPPRAPNGIIAILIG